MNILNIGGLMYINLFLFVIFFGVAPISFDDDATTKKIIYDQKVYKLYPKFYSERPKIPSPLIMDDNKELIIVITSEDKYTIIPVTVENGDTLDYSRDLWYGKGRQLDVDSADFPTLFRTGLHSESELAKTKTITGKPVDEISRIARPEMHSGEGFIGIDEDIISVLIGDNKLVKRLGMTHPQMARPLFHVFNIIIATNKDSKHGGIKGFYYNNRMINLNFHGAKGWQESIFNDEILGYWQLEIWTLLNQSEKEFLLSRYDNLSDSAMNEFINRLSFIHTGEMVPFYIQRYGFYEGHTSYRADPIAISYIFGLRRLEEIESAFEDCLYDNLNKHFLSKP